MIDVKLEAVSAYPDDIRHLFKLGFHDLVSWALEEKWDFGVRWNFLDGNNPRYHLDFERYKTMEFYHL